MSGFAFHPELFEHRTLALEGLAQHDYIWLEHFTSVDLLHDVFGLEVCGIPKEEDAEVIMAILQEIFPEWPYSDVYYHRYDRDRGWKVVIFKNRKRKKSSTTA